MPILSMSIKKPEIKPFDPALLKSVPKFNGNPFNFVPFIHAFERNVHNTDAPWFEKLNLLNVYFLKDSVKKKLSNSSYDLAFKQLKEHYRLHTENLDYLNDIYAVTDHENFEDLQTTIYEFRLVCESIEYFSLGTSVSNKLLKTALRMFPVHYVDEYLRNNNVKDITIFGLLEFMNNIVEEKGNLAQKWNHFGLKKVDKSTTSSNLRYFDFDNHAQYLTMYLSHLSSESRMKKVRKQRKCLNCLEYNHKAFNCRFGSRCELCPGKHSTMLCKKYSSLKYET